MFLKGEDSSLQLWLGLLFLISQYMSQDHDIVNSWALVMIWSTQNLKFQNYKSETYHIK